MKPYEHKINYYETDKMGITHHSNYVRFMEEARVDFLDKIGWSFDKLEEQGIVSPVLAIECNYKKSTKFADIVKIEVKVEKLAGLKMVISYTFRLGDDVVCTASSTHCFLDLNGKPIFIEKTYPEFFAALKATMEEA
jgi:acyl-CoA thioester hydrolase